VITNDPKILALAFVGGLIPSLIWLWFWLKEEDKGSEPGELLAITFVMGMIAVVVVLAVEKFIKIHVGSPSGRLILWATAEEIIKYLAVLVVLYRTSFITEPIEWPIYMITAALGFAALENGLFLVKPLSAGATVVGLLTGQLRFLGSTLLHTVASGILGIALGVSYQMTGLRRVWHVVVGLLAAIALHSVFNFFIMRNNGSDVLKVFAFLWATTVIVMLLYERVRRMSYK
jgi:protease PrsW